MKTKRSERIGAMIRILTETPNTLYSYPVFCDMFNAAKSSISEDIAAIKNIIEKFGLGKIETVAGAAGGVRFVQNVSDEDAYKFLLSICDMLSKEERVLPGDFIYTVDILSNPKYVGKMSEILATKLRSLDADFVVTVETKGIPVALMTARNLGIPLVIARRDNKMSEGPVVTINYVSGSSSRLQTMSVAKMSVSQGKKALVIDDFMKAGGTVKGICGIMKEFDVEVVGVGVIIATAEPEQKKVNDYYSLITMEGIDPNNNIPVLRPTDSLNLNL